MVQAEGVWPGGGGLRRIFGLKSEELTRDWRKLHDEELNDLCCSRNITRLITSRRMRGGGDVARMGGKEKAYSCVLCGGKTEGKGQHRRHGIR